MIGLLRLTPSFIDVALTPNHGGLISPTEYLMLRVSPHSILSYSLFSLAGSWRDYVSVWRRLLPPRSKRPPVIEGRVGRVVDKGQGG